MMCLTCEGSGRVYTSTDIVGARTGGPCPGKHCPSCSPFLSNSSFSISCPLCDGSGKIFTSIDLMGARTGGPCPGKLCPKCYKLL